METKTTACKINLCKNLIDEKMLIVDCDTLFIHRNENKHLFLIKHEWITPICDVTLSSCCCQNNSFFNALKFIPA